MTKERLSQLSYQYLQELAQKKGVDVPHPCTKDVLVDLIFEMIEDEKDDREKENLAIQIEEKKYLLSDDEDLETQEKTDYPILERYNETKVKFMLRDPSWAFAYWDIKDTQLKQLKADPTFRGLFLRVYEIKDESFSGDNYLDYFDISVQFSDTKRYINLPRQGNAYCIDLICRIHGRERILARSGTVLTPRVGLSIKEGEEEFRGSAEKIISMSWFADDRLQEDASIPQRIISLQDEYYLQLKE